MSGFSRAEFAYMTLASSWRVFFLLKIRNGAERTWIMD